MSIFRVTCETPSVCSASILKKFEATVHTTQPLQIRSFHYIYEGDGYRYYAQPEYYDDHIHVILNEVEKVSA